MRRVGTTLAAAGLVVLTSVVTGCGADEPEPTTTSAETTAPETTEPETTAPEETGSTSASDDPGDAGDAIEISIQGDQVTPSGKRVQVETGESVTLVVTSDRAGEFHVHSTPEQSLAFDKGTTELQLTVDKPGVVDVELHEPPVTVLQLEVR